MKDLKDNQTRDLMPQKFKHGGARPNSGRPAAPYQTTTMRVDVRMKGLIEAIKRKLISGAINDEDLKRFEELAAN